MEFKNEQEEKMVKFDVDMTDRELEILVEYTFKNINLEQLDEILVNWAIIDILTKQVAKAKEIAPKVNYHNKRDRYGRFVPAWK